MLFRSTLGVGGTLAYNLASGAAGLSPTNTFTVSAGSVLSNLKAGSTLTLASPLTNLTYAVVVDETTATPTVANITFSSASPAFSANTLMVTTSGYQSSFSALNLMNWASGTATGTPTLKMNGTTVTSGTTAAGGLLSYNTATGVTRSEEHTSELQSH